MNLLPPNTTPFERAFAAVTDLRFDPLSPAAREIWNPQTCPLDFLPFLAWAFSVDRWDANWSEAVKRQVIAATPALHRYKGTRAAVADALAALYVRADITEWFDQVPQGDPGTFVIRAYARSALAQGEPVLSASTIAAIRAVVAATAPVSRSFSLEIGVDVASELGASIAVNHPYRVAAPEAGIALTPTREHALMASVARPNVYRQTDLLMSAN